MHEYLRFFSYARRQRGFLVLAFLFAVVASALTALQPWPMKVLFDHVLGDKPAPGWLLRITGGPGPLLAGVVVTGFILFVLNAAIESASSWIWTASGRRMVYELAGDLFARLQRRSLGFHRRLSVGDLLGRVTVDNWCVYHVVDNLLFAPGRAFLTIGAMVFLMGQLDWTLTFISLCVAPFMVFA